MSNANSSGSISVDGARLAYEITGAGPPLVLIHGSLLDRRLWDAQVPVFARHHRVLRYDARGHGESASVVAPYAHHRDLSALLRALEITHAAVLGLSMGGRVALHLALTSPDLVSALILSGAAANGATVATELAAGRATVAAALAQGDREATAEAFLRLWVDGLRRSPEQIDPSIRAHARTMALAALAHPSLDGLDEVYDLPNQEQLRAIRVPTLVMVGEHDLPYMIESADLLARRIAGAARITVANAGHLANLEQPTAFNDAVLAFLARQAAGPIADVP